MRPRKHFRLRSDIYSFVGSLFIPTSIRQRLFLALTAVTLVSAALFQFLSGFLIAPLYLLVVHWLLGRLLDRPIRSLLQMTREGGFDIGSPSVTIAGRDEFSRIGRAVCGMANRMRRSIVEAREQNSRLDEIFSAIGEGVVIVSLEGKILKINNTARRWVGWYGDSSGRRVIEVLRSVELADKLSVIIKICLENKERLVEPTIIESMHLDGPEVKKVRVKIVPVRTDPENVVFLVFLFDLTDLHRVQDVRREFFANVSHELKTPISAIRGYAETLHDMDLAENLDIAKNFLGVIIRNTHQLSSLIDQMLSLAKLESGAVTLEIKPYDIRAGVQRVFETLTPKAREAAVSLVVDVAKEVAEFSVDPQRFDSVLLNLVDNGIKYNRPDGLVKVSVRQNNDSTLIFVEDTGVGIPDSSQLRAFERFYRVDKAHTRLGGGSGLGLAIVKHVIQAHGGTISLRSESRVGTVFTISLPKNIPGHKKIDLLTPL